MKWIIIILILLQIGCESQVPPPITYRVGDVVVLKSGGCRMTVSYDVYGNDMVWVTWMDVNGDIHHSTFRQNLLERVKNETLGY